MASFELAAGFDLVPFRKNGVHSFPRPRCLGYFVSLAIDEGLERERVLPWYMGGRIIRGSVHMYYNTLCTLDLDIFSLYNLSQIYQRSMELSLTNA